MFPLDATVLLFLILSSPVFAAATLLLWVRHRWRRFRNPKTTPPLATFPRRIVLGSFLYLTLYTLCLLWGFLVEPDWVRTTTTEIPVTRTILNDPNFRIVHLSDLHLERIGEREEKVLATVRDAHPDLIVMTGDYLNHATETGLLSEFLSRLHGLNARFGVHIVEGNWDTRYPLSDVVDDLNQTLPTGSPPVTLLEDDYALLTQGEHPLVVAGLRMWSHRRLADVLADAPSDAYRILLHHSPDAADEVLALPSDRRVDLFLCGHTHGGQVRIPFWGAVITLTRNHKKYEMGRYALGSTEMYVNRGIGMEGGFAPRVRFWCPPEVAVIDLVCPAAP